MSDGFYKSRRSILKPLDSGSINLLDLGIYHFLCLTADFRNGVAWCSSQKIHAMGGIPDRTARRRLAKLERLGFIRTWKVRGKRGNYPVLINHFPVHDAAGRGLRVSASQTMDWRTPFLEEPPEHDRDVAGNCPRSVQNVAGIQEVRSKNEEDAFQGKHLFLTSKEFIALKEAYPRIDAEAVLRRADAWCVANPGRAPTRRHARFAFAWLGRERPTSDGSKHVLTEEELQALAKQKRKRNHGSDFAA